MELLFSVFGLLLPAGFANMAPVLMKGFPLFDKPIDFGFKLKDGFYLFGSHKTFRGFIFGIIFAILILYIQVNFFPELKKYGLIKYENFNILYLGFLFGFGALFGDLIKSFLKRRVGIESGKSGPVFDQIDWVVGALIFLIPIKIFSGKIYLISIIFGGLIHPVVNLIGYLLKIKKNKF